VLRTVASKRNAYVYVFVQIALTRDAVQSSAADAANASGTIELVMAESHAPKNTPHNPAA